MVRFQLVYKNRLARLARNQLRAAYDLEELSEIA